VAYKGQGVSLQEKGGEQEFYWKQENVSDQEMNLAVQMSLSTVTLSLNPFFILEIRELRSTIPYQGYL
jgi:hypothetical protein